MRFPGISVARFDQQARPLPIPLHFVERGPPTGFPRPKTIYSDRSEIVIRYFCVAPAASVRVLALVSALG